MERINNSTQWIECLEYMKRRMKEQSFSIWLRNTKGEPNGNGEFKIGVANQFVADWINSHFRDDIEEAFVEVLGRKYELQFVICQPEGGDQVAIDFDHANPVPVRANGTGNGNSNGNGEGWGCSAKQKALILDLVEQHKLDKNAVEQLAQDRFGKMVKALNRLEASGLIDELITQTGVERTSGR